MHLLSQVYAKSCSKIRSTYPKTMQRCMIAFVSDGIWGELSAKLSCLAQITIHTLNLEENNANTKIHLLNLFGDRD